MEEKPGLDFLSQTTWAGVAGLPHTVVGTLFHILEPQFSHRQTGPVLSTLQGHCGGQAGTTQVLCREVFFADHLCYPRGWLLGFSSKLY